MSAQTSDANYGRRQLLGDVVGQTAASSGIMTAITVNTDGAGFTVEKVNYNTIDYISKYTDNSPLDIVVPESLSPEQKQLIEANKQFLREDYQRRFGLPVIPSPPQPAMDPPSRQETSTSFPINEAAISNSEATPDIDERPAMSLPVFDIPWLTDPQPAKPIVVIKFDYGVFNFKCSRHDAVYNDKARRLLVFSDSRYDFPEITASPTPGSVFKVTVLPETQYEMIYVCLADDFFSFQLGPITVDVYSAMPQSEFPEIVE